MCRGGNLQHYYSYTFPFSLPCSPSHSNLGNTYSFLKRPLNESKFTSYATLRSLVHPLTNPRGDPGTANTSTNPAVTNPPQGPALAWTTPSGNRAIGEFNFLYTTFASESYPVKEHGRHDNGEEHCWFEIWGPAGSPALGELLQLSL